MSIGVPVKLLHEAEGHTVTIELKTGELYRGKLIEAEDNMNCQVCAPAWLVCRLHTLMYVFVTPITGQPGRTNCLWLDVVILARNIILGKFSSAFKYARFLYIDIIIIHRRTSHFRAMLTIICGPVVVNFADAKRDSHRS